MIQFIAAGHYRSANKYGNLPFRGDFDFARPGSGGIQRKLNLTHGEASARRFPFFLVPGFIPEASPDSEVAERAVPQLQVFLCQKNIDTNLRKIFTK